MQRHSKAYTNPHSQQSQFSSSIGTAQNQQNQDQLIQSTFNGANLATVDINKRKALHRGQFRLASINNQQQQIQIPLQQQNNKKQVYNQQQNNQGNSLKQEVPPGNYSVLGARDISQMLNGINPILTKECPSPGFNRSHMLLECQGGHSESQCNKVNNNQSEESRGPPSLDLNQIAKESMNTSKTKIKPNWETDVALDNSRPNLNTSTTPKQRFPEAQKKNPFNSGRQTVMEKSLISESSLIQIPQGDIYKQYAESSKYSKYNSVFQQRHQSQINEPPNDNAKRSYSQLLNTHDNKNFQIDVTHINQRVTDVLQHIESSSKMNYATASQPKPPSGADAPGSRCTNRQNTTSENGSLQKSYTVSQKRPSNKAHTTLMPAKHWKDPTGGKASVSREQQIAHQQFLKCNNPIITQLTDQQDRGDHKLKQRYIISKRKGDSNLPDIKSNSESRQREELIREITDSLGEVHQVLMREEDYKNFNFIKKTQEKLQNNLQQQQFLNSEPKIESYNPEASAFQKLEINNQMIHHNLCQRTAQWQHQQQVQAQLKTKQIQMRNEDNKRMLEQVIKQLQMRGLVGVHQSALNNITNPSLEVQGVSPKAPLAFPLDIIQRNQIQMTTGNYQSSTNAGEIRGSAEKQVESNGNNKRHHKLKTKNVLSQINSIPKNHVIISKANYAEKEFHHTSYDGLTAAGD